MLRKHSSSKGRVTVPKQVRQRIKPADRPAVMVDRRVNGAVVIRPVASILQLAGSFQHCGKALTPQEERQLARKACIDRHKHNALR